MQVTVLSTSPRKGSNSLKAAKALTKLIEKAGHPVSLVHFEDYDIPMVGQGSLIKDNLSEFQKNLIQNWEQAQLVFIVAPEYNWMTSGQLINAIHQLGGADFGHLFDQKVFSMTGVSSGRGGRLPAIELMTLVNKMISFLNKTSVVSPKIFESQETPQTVDEDGNLLENSFYNKGIEEYVSYSLKIASQWFGE